MFKNYTCYRSMLRKTMCRDSCLSAHNFCCQLVEDPITHTHIHTQLVDDTIQDVPGVAYNMKQLGL